MNGRYSNGRDGDKHEDDMMSCTDVEPLYAFLNASIVIITMII